MCRNATACLSLVAALAAGLAALPAAAQDSASARRLNTGWRKVGNTALELNLAGSASGPVARVAFSADGTRLFASTASGRTFVTSDFERWQPADAIPSEPNWSPSPTLPESGAHVRIAFGSATRAYAIGRFAWRSDDGGAHWNNISGADNTSILGGSLMDVTISPTDPDVVVAAGANGIWKSMDGGLTWAGMNQDLPNFPARRILTVPDGNAGLRLSIDDDGNEVEWRPGEKTGWRPAAPSLSAAELILRAQLSGKLNAYISAFAKSGDTQYAASIDGRSWVSTDRGASWSAAARIANSAAVSRLYIDSKDSQFVLAIAAGRIYRSPNGGRFWEDVMNGLPTGATATGVAWDRGTSALYTATNLGVFLSYVDASGQPGPWSQVREGNAVDLALDPDGNQLYVASESNGVYATLAPHRLRDPRVVSAGDMTSRPAAPGALLSVVGKEVQSARIGTAPIPVFASGASETQIQVPFETTGSQLLLSMNSASGAISIGLPLQPVSPAVFVDRDGSPLVMNAESGLVLDPSAPARSGARLQILATGLGKVRPDWPAGIPAPMENAPKVIAGVRAYLDREPIEVTAAALAPGYVGFYLVEVQLPSIVNTGTSELYIEVDGQVSNRVRVYLEP